MALKLKLNEIEKDIRAEDFEEGSLYYELIKKYGCGVVLLLARYSGGTKIHILTEGTITLGARKRYYESQRICSKI